MPTIKDQLKAKNQLHAIEFAMARKQDNQHSKVANSHGDYHKAVVNSHEQ